MSLSKKQQEFTVRIALLISYATIKGYGLTFGDAFRDPRVHGEFGVRVGYGSAYSVHKYRLAVDLNLFVNGEYISDGNHSAWKELGEFWESLHPNAVWGGNFEDANHFSFVHGGYK